MRQARFFAPPDLEVAYYHCVSRVVDRRFIYEDLEKEQFLHFMRMYEAFGRLRVLAFCVMGNHIKDYRWSSYGEALGGGGLARRAVQWLVGIGHRHAPGAGPSETAALEQYRRILFGVEGGHQRGLDPEKVKEVLMSGGKLPLADYIHCRVRYFTAGVVLGRRAFVDEIFARTKERFSAKRVDGARPMRGLADEVDLCTCRDLRVFG